MENKVFDKIWFQEHQSKLLWLANSWIGKHIFRFKKMGHYLENKIVKITPYSVAELISIKGDQVELKEHFFTRNEYARKLYFYLYPLWLTMHTWDWLMADRFAPQLSFGFNTLTQYPGSIGAHNPDDGSLGFSGNTTWASVRGASGNVANTSGNSVTGSVCAGISSNSFSNWSSIFRGIWLFDTSSLTSFATIFSAVLSLYGTFKIDFLSCTPDVDVYLSTPASTSLLVASDYSQIGIVSQTGSPISYASYNGTGYNDFTLNATGISNVSLIGISKFGSRNANHDVANSVPTWSDSTASSLGCNNAYNGSNKPKLVITYTLPNVANGAFLYNMI